MSLGEILGHPTLMKDNKQLIHTSKLDYNSPVMHYACIIGQCEWANTVNQNGMILTWFAIVFMYISEGLRTLIRQDTEKGVATAYFEGTTGIPDFNTRMGQYMFGEITHGGSKKKRIIKRVAKPPLSIVLEEMLIFRLLCTNPKLRV